MGAQILMNEIQFVSLLLAHELSIRPVFLERIVIDYQVEVKVAFTILPSAVEAVPANRRDYTIILFHFF